MKLDHFLTPNTEINSTFIRLKYKSINHETPKENINITLLDIGLISSFLDSSPQARATKVNINIWEHIKLKAFAQQGKSSTK